MSNLRIATIVDGTASTRLLARPGAVASTTQSQKQSGVSTQQVKKAVEYCS